MRRPNLTGLPPLPALPTTCLVRPTTEADAPTLAAVLRRAFADGTWTADRVQAELLGDETVTQTLVVEREGEIIATASVRLLPERFPASGYLHWVAVDSAHQGQRLGYFVSLAVLHEFERLGCSDAVLETQDHRIPAIKTYLALGFRPEYTDETHRSRWAAIMESGVKP